MIYEHEWYMNAAFLWMSYWKIGYFRSSPPAKNFCSLKVQFRRSIDKHQIFERIAWMAFHKKGIVEKGELYVLELGDKGCISKCLPGHKGDFGYPISVRYSALARYCTQSYHKLTSLTLTIRRRSLSTHKSVCLAHTTATSP